VVLARERRAGLELVERRMEHAKRIGRLSMGRVILCAVSKSATSQTKHSRKREGAMERAMCSHSLFHSRMMDLSWQVMQPSSFGVVSLMHSTHFSQS